MKMRVLSSERSTKRVAPLNNVIAKYLRMVCPGVYVHLDQTPDVITVGGTKTKPIGCSILSVTPVRPSTSTKGEHPHGICGFMPSVINLPHGGITPSISLRLLPHVRTWREWNVSLVQLSLSLTNPGTIPPPPLDKLPSGLRVNTRQACLKASIATLPALPLRRSCRCQIAW